MRPAVERFAAVLEGMKLRKPRVPVLSCVTAAPFDHVRARLAESLVAPVRWREVLLALRAAGISRFVETGPGRVLTGLVRRTLDRVEATTAEEAAASHV
jgi:[acyl-carrier-protein] S-malonyltransferase